jgi:hypothetical protein
MLLSPRRWNVSFTGKLGESAEMWGAAGTMPKNFV